MAFYDVEVVIGCPSKPQQNQSVTVQGTIFFDKTSTAMHEFKVNQANCNRPKRQADDGRRKTGVVRRTLTSSRSQDIDLTWRLCRFDV